MDPPSATTGVAAVRRPRSIHSSSGRVAHCMGARFSPEGSAPRKPCECVPQYAPAGGEPRLRELADELHHRDRQLAAARRLHRPPHLDRLLGLEALAGYRRLGGRGRTGSRGGACASSPLGGGSRPWSGCGSAFGGFGPFAACRCGRRLRSGFGGLRGLGRDCAFGLGRGALSLGRGGLPRGGSARAGTLGAGAGQVRQHARLVCRTSRRRCLACPPAPAGSLLFARGAHGGVRNHRAYASGIRYRHAQALIWVYVRL
jgi:hypothetical protein